MMVGALLRYQSVLGTKASYETIFGCIYISLILHSLMNKIWNIDISQYKGYFGSKSVLGTKVRNFQRDHI